MSAHEQVVLWCDHPTRGTGSRECETRWWGAVGRSRREVRAEAAEQGWTHSGPRGTSWPDLCPEHSKETSR